MSDHDASFIQDSTHDFPCHDFAADTIMIGYHWVLQKNEHRVSQLVGLEEKFLMDRYRNGPLKPGATMSDKLLEQERIAKRFYAALVLHDLLQEVSQPAGTCTQYQNMAMKSGGWL